MTEYMERVHRILVNKGHRGSLTLAEQLIIEECFKRGNTENSCVAILLDR